MDEKSDKDEKKTDSTSGGGEAKPQKKVAQHRREPPSPQEKPLLKKIEMESEEDEDEDESDDEGVRTVSSQTVSLDAAVSDMSIAAGGSELSPEERDHIRACQISARRLEEDDVLRVSDKIGGGWRDVGNSLHFTHAQLDKIESDSEGNARDSCERMLFRWMEWKCERATLKRLSKALFNNGAHAALKALDP